MGLGTAAFACQFTAQHRQGPRIDDVVFGEPAFAGDAFADGEELEEVDFVERLGHARFYVVV